MFVPHPGSEFFHPGSRIQGQKDSRIKDFKYFNPKIVPKLSDIWSKMCIPDPDLDFLPIPLDPGSGSATLQARLLKEKLFLTFCVVDFTGHSPTREGREWWYFMQFMPRGRLQYKIFFIVNRYLCVVGNNWHLWTAKNIKGAQVWDFRSLRFSLFLHHKAFLGRWRCG